MNILVIFVSLLILISKFLDCWTTSTQITHPNQERNPRARKLFKKYGTHTTIWAVFGLSIIIEIVSLWLLFTYFNAPTYKILFILLGSFVAYTQFAVAHTNKTRILNFFTRFLLKRYSKYD